MLSFGHDLSLASRNTSSEDVSSPSQRNPNNTDKTQEKKASGLVATAQILAGCIGNCEIDYTSTLYCRSITVLSTAVEFRINLLHKAAT